MRGRGNKHIRRQGSLERRTADISKWDKAAENFKGKDEKQYQICLKKSIIAKKEVEILKDRI